MSLNHFVSNSALQTANPSTLFHKAESTLFNLLSLPEKIADWDGQEKPQYRSMRYQLFKYSCLAGGTLGWMKYTNVPLDPVVIAKVLGSMVAIDWVAEAAIWHLYVSIFGETF